MAGIESKFESKGDIVFESGYIIRNDMERNSVHIRKRGHYQENFEWHDGYDQMNIREVMRDSCWWIFNGIDRCIACRRVFDCLFL